MNKGSVKIKFIQLPYVSLLEGCGGELASLSACAPPAPPAPPAARRYAKEARDAGAQLNIHLQALFAAVEHGHLDKARTILESTDVDVNSVNNDGLSPLDVAVLANNRTLTRVLMGFGAKEGNQLKTPDALGAHLRRLAREAEARLHELAGCGAPPGAPTCTDDSIGAGCTRSAAPASGGAGPTGCAGGAAAERDKQTQHWERRTRALKRMVLGWQQMKVPPAPLPPELDVCGAHSVTVRLRDHPQLPTALGPQQRQAGDGALLTKYRVQWSSRADFSNICGEREVACGGSGARASAAGLTRGRRYFFRAQAGNLRGWGPFVASVPRSVVPSSWRDVDSRQPRYEASATCQALETLATQARLARGRAGDAPPAATTQRTQTKKKTTTIRQLFTAASKFQKNLRRGVYLACILYHEDKVLVTNEDFLPVIEVDDTYPTCIYTDFHWLMKVSCCWDDVKTLRSDMEKHTSSSIHFRLKLLTAAAQMQSALCIQDLGQIHHNPLRGSHGTLVVSCVRGVRSPKAVSVLNARWLPLARLRRRLTAISEDNTMGELLMASVHEQIGYNQVSNNQLSRGLYLGYLKLQSSVEVVRVVVPARTPNVPPHVRVRDNPHVSAEEWEYLRGYQNESASKNDEMVCNRKMSITSLQAKIPTESQQMFLDQISSAAKRLFNTMDIPIENALTHRLYDLEVIDLNNDVSFIMICPPADMACSVPGQKEILLQKGDLLSLPIQAFEMIHLQTYHNNIINKYSRLSCVLELDMALATHSHREAFSTIELQQAKERVAKLEDLQSNLNGVWKEARWLMDLIGFARDKDKGSNNGGILLKYLIHRIPKSIVTVADNGGKDNTLHNSQLNINLQVDLLQLPQHEPKIMKSSPGRGSWPGPAASASGNNTTNLLQPEISKSEQHLCMVPRENSMCTLNLSGSQYLSATSEIADDHYSRKSSADSQFTHSSGMISSQNFSNVQFSLKSNTVSANSSTSRLPPSRSEDTLLMSQTNSANSRRRSNILNTSLSATSSPLLHAKPFYSGSMVSVHTANTTNTSESMHSLSSDSESQSCPITTSTPAKMRPKFKHPRTGVIAPSKSMTNVKSNADFTDTGQGNNMFLKPTTYLKPTLNAIQSENECNDKEISNNEEKEEGNEKPAESKASEQPGILQVYAAYDTGLAAGTSLKLHVTPRTSAREVIDLVVKQLNMAAVLKGKSGPVYGPERLSDFCLVAVIGARERCLRDDFRPLQLQNPWRKGRLYVRLRHDVLAAIQHSSRQPAYI